MAPAKLPTVETNTVTERSGWRQNEIQWRGIQRDVIATSIGLLVFFGALGTGVGALFAPIVLLFPATYWLQHDRRIGRNAQYLREAIEPRLKDQDGIEGWEDFLDRVESGRSWAQRFTFNSIMTRLFFPTLQTLALGFGVARYATSDPHHRAPLWTVITLTALGLAIITFTFFKVKHQRFRSDLS